MPGASISRDLPRATGYITDYGSAIAPELDRLSSTSLYSLMLSYDGRLRLSNFWVPTQPKKKQHKDATADEDGHDLLLRAGFLRQAHSGIFHLLPLGLRVQTKIENLIDKHMRSLGASKVSLSSLSSEHLWQLSGRLKSGQRSEFFRLEDRKQIRYLLSPTHEEEITAIIANAVHSYKDLPLRLYQVSRKYRDEARPRQGLLRGREFVMKDLYTFDRSEEEARKTYEEVRQAYRSFLDELRLPYFVAAADSGNMGGSLSHEYHFASNKGEDTVIRCDRCGHSVNEELFVGDYNAYSEEKNSDPTTWTGVTKDRKTLVHFCFPSSDEINPHAIKLLRPDIDTSIADIGSVELALPSSEVRHVFYCDPRISPETASQQRYPIAPGTPIFALPTIPPRSDRHIIVTKARPGDKCPSCDQNSLALQKAIEIGHTFHLGTRYSAPLSANILNALNQTLPVSMGCHGIGVSRIIGTIASLMSDHKGLNWPLKVSPFEVAIVPTRSDEKLVSGSDQLFDELKQIGVDAVIDDRDRPAGWKLNDADLIGYPILIVIGKDWASEVSKVELQCRRLGIKEQIPASQLSSRVMELRDQL
nr:proline--trna ligase [Quercus suber]